MSLVLERAAFSGVAAFCGRFAAELRDSSLQDSRGWPRIALKLSVFAAVAVLGAFWGFVVAVADLNALYLAASLIGCVFIIRDFRVGVVLLILLMPISSTSLFPRAMLGIKGLNPANLLLVGTLGSYLLQGLFDGSLRRFMPRPLLWLYIVPIIIAGALGLGHVGDIAPTLLMFKEVESSTAAGYLRVEVISPLLMVAFALLVGAAVSRSEKPEKFLIPMLIAVWVTSLIVIVFVYQSGITLGALASSTSREFLSALGMHANEWGRLYVVAYALLLFTWAETKESGLKIALLASMGAVVVALILTFSRGSFLGFIVVNMLFLLWRRNARAMFLFALLGAVALFALPEAVYDRMATGFGGRPGSGFEGGADAISAGRVDLLWLPLLPDVLRSPVYGHGLGSILWSEAMRRGAGVTILAVGHPHNAYLQALLDMGIVGLVLLCAYFVHVWKGFRALSVEPALNPTLRGFYLGAAAGLASLLISYVTDSSLLPKPEQVFLWLAIGMMYGQRAGRAGREPRPG
jgi:O-antigen ligase